MICCPCNAESLLNFSTARKIRWNIWYWYFLLRKTISTYKILWPCVCVSVCPAMHSEMPGRILTKLCVVGPVVMGPCTMPLIFCSGLPYVSQCCNFAIMGPILMKLWVVNDHVMGKTTDKFHFWVQGCHIFLLFCNSSTVSPIWMKLWVVNNHTMGSLMTSLILKVQGCHIFGFFVTLQRWAWFG